MIKKCLEEKAHSVYLLCPECYEFVPLSFWRIYEVTRVYRVLFYAIGKKNDRLFVQPGETVKAETESEPHLLCHLVLKTKRNQGVERYVVEYCVNRKFYPRETPFCCIYIDAKREKIVIGSAAELMYGSEVIQSLKAAAREAGLLRDLAEAL